MLEIPPAIRTHLIEHIELDWRAPSDGATAAIKALPVSMSEGVVELIASGGAFGRYIEGRLDRIGNRIAMEILTWDRMSEDLHYRIWDDGTREALPSYDWFTAKRHQHNKEMDGLLAQRGFLRRTSIARGIHRDLRSKAHDAR